MRILKKISQNRRDFSAVLVCEHCEATQELKSGYDDTHYHENVIPVIKCAVCGKTASSDYEPQATKYPEDLIV